MSINTINQTGDSVAGTSTSTTYTYKTHSRYTEKGWECPRCGRINAPWVRQCDCTSWNVTCDDTTTGDATTTGDDWWKKYVKCDSDTFKIHPYEITYTTAHNPIVGGSDYWDNTEKLWSNVLKNVSNIKEVY